ncbi:MAG: trypsin-like peptidase domain-containing protein [Thaumarchaeota archaeon]|nr:trypsin-like peptidase domain-containing protein [Nitrososphaerota archaeon]
MGELSIVSIESKVNDMGTLSLFEEQMTKAVEKLSESVVSVNSTRLATDYRFGIVPIEGAGSGLVIRTDGYIITNHHVINEANRVQVHLRDGRNLEGDVIGSDPETDIAVIRVEAKDLPVATLGDSESLKVGQIAIAIGNSLGLPGGHTVSAGVVSAVGRPLPGSDFIFEGLIQTDASINPGNSGGPLSDLAGRVIGINSAIIPYAQGVGFAIPINTIKKTIKQIIEKGRVIRPWIGISGVSLTPAIAKRYSLPTNSGVLLMEISPESPAYESGLRIGDIMVGVGEEEIKEMKHILTALSNFSIGEVIEISVLRMGGKYQTSLRLLEKPLPMTDWRRRSR